MAIDDFAEVVRNQMAHVYGDTSDLSEELVNTLCNLYYFTEKAKKLNFGGLTDLQEIHPGKSKESLIQLYMSHMGHVAASVTHAPDMIKSMRDSRAQNPEIFSYLERLTIDIFKYSIDGAERKTPIRRSIERKFKTPCEHVHLARKFKVPFRR
jgi:hypothetical protein